jgi:hypothetical protein
MGNIHERSLIRVGDGGLAIVIPKSWIAHHRLEAGDVVPVKTNSNLIVKPIVLRKWKRKGGKLFRR